MDIHIETKVQFKVNSKGRFHSDYINQGRIDHVEIVSLSSPEYRGLVRDNVVYHQRNNKRAQVKKAVKKANSLKVESGNKGVSDQKETKSNSGDKKNKQHDHLTHAKIESVVRFLLDKEFSLSKDRGLIYDKFHPKICKWFKRYSEVDAIALGKDNLPEIIFEVKSSEGSGAYAKKNGRSQIRDHCGLLYKVNPEIKGVTIVVLDRDKIGEDSLHYGKVSDLKIDKNELERRLETEEIPMILFDRAEVLEFYERYCQQINEKEGIIKKKSSKPRQAKNKPDPAWSALDSLSIN